MTLTDTYVPAPERLPFLWRQLARAIPTVLLVAGATAALCTFPLVKSASAEVWGPWWRTGYGVAMSDTAILIPAEVPVQVMFAVGGTGKASIWFDDECGAHNVVRHYPSVQLPAAYVFTVLTIPAVVPSHYPNSPPPKRQCGLVANFFPRKLPLNWYYRWPASKGHPPQNPPQPPPPPSTAKFV